jgi:hypothetical protein
MRGPNYVYKGGNCSHYVNSDGACKIAQTAHLVMGGVSACKTAHLVMGGVSACKTAHLVTGGVSAC